MRLFRKKVCARLCGGVKAVHVCRVRRSWRESKCKRFDDIEDVDFACPYGLPIEYDPYQAGPPTDRDKIRDTVGQCRYATLSGKCCSQRYHCDYPSRKGYLVSGQACNISCDFYVAKHTIMK